LQDGNTILSAWAEEFSSGNAAGASAEAVDLHVADTAVAFFASCAAPESHLLARFLCGGASPAAGPAAEAGAIAAVARRSECDDIHVASCITPGSIVVPVALAMGTMGGDDRFDRAVTAGYATGLRLGSALGGAEAFGSGIWPTYFAAPLMAAATASVCLGLDAQQTASALALAAGGTAGRPGRPTGYPSGRWLAIGEAVVRGCRSALAAAEGFRGDLGLVSPQWLVAAAGPGHVRPDALGSADGIEAVGLKPFVAARQTINAVVAFQAILNRGIAPETIQSIEIRVPPINAAMVARAASADDRLSTIANMHVQIAAAALRPDLLYDIERLGQPAADLSAFGSRISIVPDSALEAYLPGVWAARVCVVAGGRRFDETCTAVPGDPGRGDAGAVVRGKLARMVPKADQDVCAGILSGSAPGFRHSPRAALRQRMQEALEGLAAGLPAGSGHSA